MNKELEHLKTLRGIIDGRIDDIEKNRENVRYVHSVQTRKHAFSGGILKELQDAGILVLTEEQNALMKYEVEFNNAFVCAEIKLKIVSLTENQKGKR